MPARLIDGKFSEGLDTVGRLIRVGEFDDALGAAIRKDGNAQRAVAAMRTALLGEGTQGAQATDRKLELVHGLWTPPAEQIVQVRRWNDLFGWGFKPEQFTALEQSIPEPVDPDRLDLRLTATTIEICLPKGAGMNPVQRTFEELWRIAAMRQDRHYRWDKLRSDRKHLKLLDGIEHKPGIKWVRDDMGANWEKSVGMYPQDVRDPRISPHASILSAAALHPGWVQSMDEVNIPYVWIAGYMVMLDGDGEWSYVPILGFSRGARKVGLYAYSDGNRLRYYAVPSRRES